MGRGRGKGRRRDALRAPERPLEEDAHAEARERAERRVKLFGELLRYGITCGVLLIFAPPIGLAVGFWWGIGLARRWYALEAEPRLREHWTQQELERGSEPRAEQGTLLSELRVADLLAAALAARADRVARLGVELRQQSDAAGAMRGDPVLLERALGELLDRSLDALGGAGGRPRLDVECGENLAGTAVWVRVRTDGAKAGGPGSPDLTLARRIAEAHGGTLEAHAAAGAGREILLTLPKQGAADPLEEASAG